MMNGIFSNGSELIYFCYGVYCYSLHPFPLKIHGVEKSRLIGI